MKIRGIFLIGIISIKILGTLSCSGKPEKKDFATNIEIAKQGKDLVTKIEVEKVDFYITSIIHIDCNKYEEHFNGMKSTYIIEDKDSIRQICHIIDNLQRDTSNYRPDVRAKMLFYHKNNRIDTLCMSLVGILINGESFLVDKELVVMIEKL